MFKNFDKSSLKIGIVGAGNIGQVLGVSLASEGFDIELVTRSPKGIRIDNACVFEIAGDFGDKTYLIPTVEKMDDMTEGKDIIFIATRTFDIVNACKQVLPKLKENGVIVTIQNVFSIDKVAKVLPSSKSVCMYLDFVCTKDENIMRVNDLNGLTLGCYNKDAFEKMQLVQQVLETFCTVHITNDIFGFTLGRNIMNSTISCLGAISGLRLGEILSSRRGKFLFTKIITEAINLATRFKIQVLPYNGQFDYYLFTSNTFKGRLYRKRMLKILKMNNGNVKSSVLDDIEHGKKTEIEFLLGGIIRYAEKFKIDTRYMKAVYTMIKEIEAGERRINANAFFDEKLNIGR